MKRRTLGLLLFVVTLVTAMFGALGWLLFTPAVAGNESDVFMLKISRGMGFNSILTLMHEQGILTGTTKVKYAAAILGLKDKMKAGLYEIRGGISSHDLLRQLSDGKVAVVWVTIPEGLHTRQIASILRQKIEVDSSNFLSLSRDPQLIASLGLEVESLEGFLFPNTYAFYWGMTPRAVISTMVRQFKRQFNDSLQARAKELGMSLTEVVTLASIIEGEAVVDAERTTISAVYWNRIRRGMLLQADPTVQYIIPDGPRRLLNRDLKIVSPYNTYKYPGLPPGPINNPGLASLKATLYPADVKYLYFVANGDGSHTFSRNLKEHLRAKARFDKLRRRVTRQQRNEKAERN